MPSDPTELARVLAALENATLRRDLVHLARADAARLLRDLAKDFAHFAPYVESGVRALCPDPTSERRRLDAALKRWRLEQ